MKKLLQINVGLSGSTGTIADNIGQMAIANGWKSYIAFGRSEKDCKSHKIKIGNKLDIYMHVLMTRLFDRQGLFSKCATKKLIKQIKEIKPDIIHLHNIHGYYLNYPLLFQFLKEYKKPVIWTLHDCWAMTGHCAYFDYIKCNKWKTKCYDCHIKKSYPSSFFIDRSQRNFFDKQASFLSIKNNLILVPVSDWLANICSQSFFKNTTIKRIHNGIDITVFKPAALELEKAKTFKKYGITTQYFVLGVASIWTKRKGLDDFIKLRSLLSDDYTILLVGLSKKQIQSLPNGIVAIQRTENINELAKIYSVADVFVNPTWEDNFPTTNLEALACGTPVITYKTGGSVESVSKETGLSVEKGNINSLVDAIKEIQAKGKLFYSENCRRRAVELYNKDDRYKEYIELYNKLLGYK